MAVGSKIEPNRLDGPRLATIGHQGHDNITVTLTVVEAKQQVANTLTLKPYLDDAATRKYNLVQVRNGAIPVIVTGTLSVIAPLERGGSIG